MNKTCLGCKFFKIKNKNIGFCRVNKKDKNQFPKVQLSNSCDKWGDCGQNYFIRLGWLKANENKDSK